MSIAPDGRIQIDWGDGTAITDQPASNPTATHQYTTNGVKAIVARAVRADGSTETGRGTGAYTVAPATLQSITPPGGPATGGTPVTIIGTGLLGTTMVFFASNQATNVAVVSDGLVTCTSPAGTPSALVNVSAFVRNVATAEVQYQYAAAEEEAEEEAAPARAATRKRAR